MSIMKKVFSWIKGICKKGYALFDKALSCVNKGFFYLLDNFGFFAYGLILFAISIYVRVEVFEKTSGDIRSFLIPWYSTILEGGFSALGKSIGDYTPAYMYILYIISIFKFPADSTKFLIALKISSAIFDYVNAIFICLIVYKLLKNRVMSITASGLYLMLPTVFFNSAWWGQCDAIYVSFIVMSLYALLQNKQRLSLIAFGCSFAFKLQSIFFLPVFLIFYLQKKLKLRYFVYVPIVYVLFALPSVIAGRPFVEILEVYVNQAGNSYTQLTLNSSTFSAFLGDNFETVKYLDTFNTLLAVAMTGIFIYLIYVNRIKFEDKDVITLALFFAILMPFFMPHMHERYFYMADTLCVIYAVLNPKKCYISILTALPSLFCYLLYLFGISIILDSSVTLRVGATMYIVVLFLLGRQIFDLPRYEEEKNETQPKKINLGLKKFKEKRKKKDK